MCTGNLFLRLYAESQKPTDLDKAITVYETGVRITPDGHECQGDIHAKLGEALLHHAGDMVDIEMAISAYNQAIHLTPDGHADKPGHLNNLGNSFAHHFECYETLLILRRQSLLTIRLSISPLMIMLTSLVV
jgi:tetratricopeptide (TPR) repeat protein